MRLANNIGKDIIVEMIDDSVLPKPKNLETVMQIPDLLTPGINEIDWNTDKKTKFLFVSLLFDFLPK